MNRREMIQKVVDLMLEIEATTDRCVFFDYSGHVDQFSVSVVASKKEYNTRVAEVRFGLDYVCDDQEYQDEIIKKLEEVIEKAKAWKPEHSPLVHLCLDREKAMELGLI